MSEMEKILQNWDTADEYLNSKVEENKLPTFTTEEYERVKDSIPVGTKFIITDDEGGDEPEPTPTPSGVANVNSYIFRKNGDSYTISIKDKSVYSTDNYNNIPFTVLMMLNNTAYLGVATIKINSTGNVYMYAYLNGSTSSTPLQSYFDISIDENKEEITLTRNETDATNRRFVITI